MQSVFANQENIIYASSGTLEINGLEPTIYNLKINKGFESQDFNLKINTNSNLSYKIEKTQTKENINYEITFWQEKNKSIEDKGTFTLTETKTNQSQSINFDIQTKKSNKCPVTVEIKHTGENNFSILINNQTKRTARITFDNLFQNKTILVDSLSIQQIKLKENIDLEEKEIKTEFFCEIDDKYLVEQTIYLFKSKDTTIQENKNTQTEETVEVPTNTQTGFMNLTFWLDAGLFLFGIFLLLAFIARFTRRINQK